MSNQEAELKEKITITRALAELKLIDSRISKIIDETKFAVCVTKKTNYNINKNDFSSGVLSKQQSLMDLISRRENIKAAIIRSNVSTIVKIGSKTMSVASAIEMKQTMRYKENLLGTLRRQRQQVTQECETHKSRVKQAIDANITQICSRDVKPDPSTIQDITDMMWKNDPVDIYDPIGLDKTIDALEKEIEEFNLNVDFVLSESNSLTAVEI
jgi:hypothetical protein